LTILEDGTKNLEVMNMAQIRKAWDQGATKGNSPAHKNFPDQMCKKTVTNRAVKLLISSSDDSALTITKVDPIERPPVEDIGEGQIIEEIKAKENTGEEISIDQPAKEGLDTEKTKTNGPGF
jgi:recombination protein RecT